MDGCAREPQAGPGMPRREPQESPRGAPAEGAFERPKKAQGAPAARNGQFAKEKVLEKQHFGDRLPKLGF